jgi:hypothetical protein
VKVASQESKAFTKYNAIVQSRRLSRAVKETIGQELVALLELASEVFVKHCFVCKRESQRVQ